MVIPAPNDTVAPVWKLVPVTVTVRLAPGTPKPGVTPVIVGRGGTVTLAAAVDPSAKLVVSVKLAPVPKSVGLWSAAKTKKAPPSATAKFTAPVPAAFNNAPS